MMSFIEIPYFTNSLFGIIQGMKSFCTNGTQSLITASACGESEKATCLIPNPYEILAASGEQELIVMSGENFLIDSNRCSIRFMLARSFLSLEEPPCFPTITRLICFNLASLTTSR